MKDEIINEYEANQETIEEEQWQLEVEKELTHLYGPRANVEF